MVTWCSAAYCVAFKVKTRSQFKSSQMQTQNPLNKVSKTENGYWEKGHDDRDYVHNVPMFIYFLRFRNICRCFLSACLFKTEANCEFSSYSIIFKASTAFNSKEKHNINDNN